MTKAKSPLTADGVFSFPALLEWSPQCPCWLLVKGTPGGGAGGSEERGFGKPPGAPDNPPKSLPHRLPWLLCPQGVSIWLLRCSSPPLEDLIVLQLPPFLPYTTPQPHTDRTPWPRQPYKTPQPHTDCTPWPCQPVVSIPISQGHQALDCWGKLLHPTAPPLASNHTS